MAFFRLGKVYALPVLFVSLLSGCNANLAVPGAKINPQDTICVSPSGMVVSCGVIVPKNAQELYSSNVNRTFNSELMNAHTLEASSNNVMIGEYIEQISTELLQNMAVPVNEASIGITPFVEFSTSLSSVNMLGTILAEEFIFELQRNGIVVVDYKVQDKIEVKGSGDFIFSRNKQKLTLNGVMEYVLVGTLMYNKQGIWINARIVNIESKAVVSSAKKLIPYFILDNIVPYDTNRQS